jgi:hypothetical protein
MWRKKHHKIGWFAHFSDDEMLEDWLEWCGKQRVDPLDEIELAPATIEIGMHKFRLAKGYQNKTPFRRKH